MCLDRTTVSLLCQMKVMAPKRIQVHAVRPEELHVQTSESNRPATTAY